MAAVERLLGFATIFVWQTRWFVTTACALAVLVVVHRGLRVVLRTNTTAIAFERIIDRTTRDDVATSASSVAIIDAAHEATRIAVDVAIPLFADAVATVASLALLASLHDGFMLAGGGVVAVAIIAAAFVLIQQRSSHGFDSYMTMIDGVTDALDGRTELLASGHVDRYRKTVRETIAAWRRQVRFAALRALRTSQWPAIVAGGLAIALVVSRGFDPRVLKQVVLLLVVIPAWFGLLRATHDLAKTAPKLQPLVSLFVTATTERTGTGRSSDTTIAWRGITVTFGERDVLDRVSVDAKPGEVVVLTGKNGTGKTTLMLVALGLRSPSAGEVSIGGALLDTLDLDAWRRRTCFLPQRPFLPPRRSVRVAMLFPSATYNDATLEHSLRRAGIWERLSALTSDPLAVCVDQLSAGERQRVALARALSHDADVFFLDEPDANLDTDGVRLTCEIARELADAHKLVVLAAHTPALIAAADVVVELRDGHARFSRPAVNIDVAPRHQRAD